MKVLVIGIINFLFLKILNNNITTELHHGIYFGNTNNSVIGFDSVFFDNLNTFSNQTNIYGIVLDSSWIKSHQYLYNNASDFYESII